MNRLGVALLTVGHAVDDLYQGTVPALLPFFVAERHCSYAAASGLVLAGNLLASIAQPAFGALADATSLRVTLTVLTGLPVLALLLATTLRDPRSGRGGGSRVSSAGSAAGRAG